MRIISVVSRCLGPLSRWQSVLKSISDQGFNAIHFTPIQHYGLSRSHYSLADQTQIDDYFYEKGDKLPESLKFENLSSVMQSLKSDLGLLGIVDIVLNHTANNSHWIQHHPESCYSTDKVPRLWPAWLFDAEISRLSDEFSKGNVAWCKSAPYLRNESDLDLVILEIRKRIEKLNLREFFTCEPIKTQKLDSLNNLTDTNSLDFKVFKVVKA